MGERVVIQRRDGSAQRGSTRQALAVALLLLALTVAALHPVLDCGFTNFDDDLYVTANEQVRQGLSLGGVRWALTATAAANWHPLTWISHMLDVELWGLDPRGHHGTNLVLHLANTILLFLVFRHATRALWPSALVAALFATHPLRVEAVAWVAERKELLSTLFGLLAIVAYLRWTRGPGPIAYLAILGGLALSLTAKPMWVTLPFVLLLLDVWPLGRLHDLREGWVRLWEKLPLFVLSGTSSVITLWVQRRGGAVGNLETYSGPSRLVNAAIAYLDYLRKTLWPADLAVFYPHEQHGLLAPKFLVATCTLAMISALAIRQRHRRPWLGVGWFWFVGMLVPVIGLVQVGEQGLADRYTYVPLIGIFILVAWGLAEALDARSIRPGWQPIAVAAIVLGLAVSAFGAHRQAQVWSDSVMLFEHALAVTEGNYVAHINLGLARSAADDLPGAIEHYALALEIHEESAVAHNNLGAVLDGSGRRSEAIPHYRRALAIDPGYVQAMRNLGLALFAEGQIPEARTWIASAARGWPDDAASQYEWGTVLAHSSDWDGAIARFRDALRLQPDLAEARYNLALALHYRGDAGQAWDEMQIARGMGYKPAAGAVEMLSRALAASRAGTPANGGARPPG